MEEVIDTKKMYIIFSRDLSDKLWDKLLKNFGHYGISALTTYYGARYSHNHTAADSLLLMRHQCNVLGHDYPGGLGCTIYRGNRINETLQRLKNVNTDFKRNNQLPTYTAKYKKTV